MSASSSGAMAAPSLLWNADLGCYRDPATGRFISRAAVRRAFEESLANLTRKTDTLADDLRAGRISLNEWRSEMREIIKQTHMAAAEVANGGRAQMTQADYGKAGQEVRRHYQYLERWVNEIKAGAPIDGRMESRAKLYLVAARNDFLQLESRTLEDRGFDEVRSILEAGARHCAECSTWERRGFRPLGQMVWPGSRQCFANCRCRLEYRNSQTGQVLAA